MIIDKLMQFSDAQAVNATVLSENVVAVAGKSPNTTVDLGAGESVWLVVKLASAAAGTGKLSIALETSDNANMTGSKVVSSSGEINASALKPFQQLFAVQLPLADYGRYLAVRYTVNGTLTGAKVDAFITKDADVLRAYASGYEMV